MCPIADTHAHSCAPASFVKPHPCGFMAAEQIRREEMRRNIFLATVGLVFLFGNVINSQAQVKQIEMHIAGYLCGN